MAQYRQGQPRKRVTVRTPAVGLYFGCRGATVVARIHVRLAPHAAASPLVRLLPLACQTGVAGS